MCEPHGVPRRNIRFVSSVHIVRHIQVEAHVVFGPTLLWNLFQHHFWWFFHYNGKCVAWSSSSVFLFGSSYLPFVEIIFGVFSSFFRLFFCLTFRPRLLCLYEIAVACRRFFYLIGTLLSLFAQSCLLIFTLV